MSRILAVIAVGLALVGSARAQDSDAKALARIVAPFVNETTQVVGHVDVKKLDIKKYFQAVFAFVGENNQEVNAMRDLALMVQEKLLKAGVRHVLGVVNVSNPRGGNLPEVVVVAPLGKSAEVDDLPAYCQGSRLNGQGREPQLGRSLWPDE